MCFKSITSGIPVTSKLLSLTNDMSNFTVMISQ